MTAEIVCLTTAGPATGPKPDVVKLLAPAKRGEIKGLGVFVVHSNEDVSVAGASWLQHRMLSDSMREWVVFHLMLSLLPGA